MSLILESVLQHRSVHRGSHRRSNASSGKGVTDAVKYGVVSEGVEYGEGEEPGKYRLRRLIHRPEKQYSFSTRVWMARRGTRQTWPGAASTEEGSSDGDGDGDGDGDLN